MKCIVCSKELTGRKKKFCSQKCYFVIRLPIEKKHYRKYSPYLPKRSCIWCGKSFRPRGNIHVCCNSKCLNQLENQKAKERRDVDSFNMYKWGETGIILRPKRKRVKPTLTDEPMSLKNSEHKNEIEKYLANGGKIKSIPDQINGRTPEVNVTNLSGWSVETLFGFGYELQLMDELSSTSEVDDVN